MRNLSEIQSKTEIANETARIKLEEETKRIQLQKEIELKALRFEYEKKQAAAKTEEERKRLALEEDLKRKEIQIKFDEEQKAVALKYDQEKSIAKINQEKKDAIAKAELESSQNQKNIWAVGAGLSLLLLGFAGFSYNQKRKDNKKIAEEKQKSDDLLLNILPYEVAEELKEKGKTSAKHFDEVSVLFTDFVNFTANSERIGVQEVLNELNICFTEFDSIMEKYNLEKIKTIGDAYLAVSGLPVPNDQHAKNAVNASLEILTYIQQRKKDNPNALDIRIGIHSGPIIAGIVGVKKFAYDIWGDTVNTAARMEQNSALGKLNVSEATYNLIKNDFTFEYRGKIETKGKGALEMYFVNS
ncbi:MAG TPA: adenylate/guanylate cyclase domain-containing protein [Chryseobacterium sp.]